MTVAMELLDERKKILEAWLAGISELKVHAVLPMQGDASFRRYYRITTDQGSFVAMDAPPSREKCDAYVAITRMLRAHGLHSPDIIASDLERGLLLITDYGDLTYLKALCPHNAGQLYQQALVNLATLQGCRNISGHTIPSTCFAWMQQEWAFHKEWFLGRWLGLPFAHIEKELDDCYGRIIEEISKQPAVLVHRDYHSANLMVLPEGTGILDFQDASMGPLTYDLVSLLRDCYIDWPNEQVVEWALSYWELLKTRGNLTDVTPSLFLRWFDWTGVQRHLKAIMIFARKYVRDGETRYLQHIPRTLRYLDRVTSTYPELKMLHTYLTDSVTPAVLRVMSSCAP